MTGPTTLSEAWDMPFTDVLNRYQVLENRDTMSRAIATLRVRGEWNDDRSPDPDDYPPLTAAEHLEMLAVGEVIARHYRRPSQVHHTVIVAIERQFTCVGRDYQRVAEGNAGLFRYLTVEVFDLPS
jgi:hypothetical protein